MSVVGAALRGFGRALKNRKRGKTITSVKPAERLTQEEKILKIFLRLDTNII